MNGATYKPVKALVIYSLNSNYSNKYYIEDMNIVKGKLSSGKPLNMKSLQDLKQIFAGIEGDQIILDFQNTIPPNVIMAKQSPMKVIWGVSGKKRTLLFSDHLNIPCGKANTPNLLFCYTGKLKVFAYQGELNLDTELLRAPFFNTNDVGDVCLGNVKLPDRFKSYDELLSKIETAFYNSYFTAIHGKPIKGNLNLFWKRLIGSKRKFPYSELTILNRKVRGLI